MNRRTVLLGAAGGGVALALAGCGDGSGGATASGDAITVVPAGTPSPTPTPTPSPSPSPTAAAAGLATWACVGDSMTHGVVGVADSIPYVLSQLTGLQFDDLGVIAQTSTEIAARMGALPTTLSLAGDTIPTSGRVALTALDPRIVNHTGPDTVIDGRAVQLAILGQLNGVAGSLRREADGGRPNDQVPIGDFGFVRTADGAAVAVAPGSTFVPETRERYRAAPMILRMGFNNRTDFRRVKQDHLAMFAWSKAQRGQILLLDPPISYYDNAAAIRQSDRIAAWLEKQTAARGMPFFRIHDYVASRRGLHDAGVTPTADDLRAIADRRTPMSATVGDGLHYTAAMNHAVAAKLRAVLGGLGVI